MKKYFVRTLCIAFILLLCLPMVACDFEFGGLVGELLADKEPGGVVPDQWESDLVIEDILPDVLPDIEIETEIETSWVDEFISQDIIEMPTEDITYQDYDTTEYHTTEPPIVDPPIPEPVLHFSFDECDAWIEDQQAQQFFTPGMYANWDRYATIDNYNVEYVRVWGWVAFQSEQIGQVGYRIDDGEPVYDDAFIMEAEQPIIDAALAMGAQSAARISIMIPVRQLSGEHVIEIVARDGYEFGYQASIAFFEFEKAVDPYAPLFVFDPSALLQAAQKLSHDQHTYLSEDSSFITLSTLEGIDPWFTPLMPGVNDSNGIGYKNVHYVVIAYRTEYAGSVGQLYLGSGVGPTGQGDEYKFDYVGDGAWHTYIVDLSKVESVNSDFDLDYLRYDIFDAPKEAGQSVDIAYIAGFDSMEDVFAFQTQNNLG